jgi:subtilisin family serine protease
MFVPGKTCLLWGLGIISLLAGWQGVDTSLAMARPQGYYSHVTALKVEVPASSRDASQPGQSAVEATVPSALTAPSLPIAVESPAQEQSWPLGRIEAAPLPSIARTEPPVLVAVLDTGIDGTHRDLAGKVVADIGFVEDASTADIYGHGTPIAGIIAADADIGSGVTGLAPESRLLNVKVADDHGKARDTDIAEGIIWAVDNGACVVNISIELSNSTTRLKEAVDYAWSHGAVIVAAAGNDGSSQPVYPAAYESCLGVTAIRENGDLAPLANSGEWVDVAAPGFDIYTTLPGNTFGLKHGTSFAAAYVSGLAALLFPLVTDDDGDGYLNDEVCQVIYAACLDTGIPGTGRGLIDVAGSLALAEETSNK